MKINELIADIFSREKNLFINVQEKIVSDHSIIITDKVYDSIIDEVQKPVEADFLFIKNGKEQEMDFNNVTDTIKNTIDMFNTACTHEIEYTRLIISHSPEEEFSVYEMPLVYIMPKYNEVVLVKHKYISFANMIGLADLKSSRDANMIIANYEDGRQIFILGIDRKQFKSDYLRRLSRRVL